MKPITYLIFILFILNFVLFSFGSTQVFTLEGFLSYADQYLDFKADSEFINTLHFAGLKDRPIYTIDSDWGAFNFLKVTFEGFLNSLRVLYNVGDFVYSVFNALFYIYNFLMSLMSYFFSFI